MVRIKPNRPIVIADRQGKSVTVKPNVSAGLQGIQGEVGPIGTSNFAGTPAGATNLNVLTIANVYHQASVPSSLPALNYPVDHPGVLEVFRNGGWVIQRYTPTANTGGGSRAAFYERRSGNTGNTWYDWQAVMFTKVRHAAGRVVSVWDNDNLQEQLIYGDTGWRDIGASLLNGVTADYIRIRRVGHSVYLAFQNLIPPANTGVDVINIPTGFTGGTAWTYIPTRPGGSVTPQDFLIKHPNTLALSLNGYNRATHGGFSFTMPPWSTTDNWPTNLPGTAVGTIPNL